MFAMPGAPALFGEISHLAQRTIITQLSQAALQAGNMLAFREQFDNFLLHLLTVSRWQQLAGSRSAQQCNSGSQTLHFS